MIRKLTHGRKRWIATILSVVAAVFIYFYLWRKFDVNWTRLAEAWRGANKPLLLYTFAFSAFWHIVLGTDKWYRILKRLGAPTTWLEVMFVRMGSDPIRVVVPFKSGELANAAYFYQRGELGFARSVSSILFDKVLNFIGTFYWLFFGLAILAVARDDSLFELIPREGQERIWEKLAVMVAAGVVAGCLLVFAPVRDLMSAVGGKIHRKVRRLVDEGLAPFREMTMRQKGFFLLYGIFFQMRPLLVLYLLFAVFGSTPAMTEILTFGSIVVLMANIPLTPSSVGVREGVIMFLFASYGTSSSQLLIGSLMLVAIQIVPAILGIPFAPRLLRATIEAIEGEKETR
ncbi:flippase-like domain-containing protein [Candidatus Sumerlaeota bacterium]|nr:flippase-like domain-containing protein [Candidatus Sumerlaeota bacterium]